MKKSQIDIYNSEIKSWDFEKPLRAFLDLLVERNKTLIEMGPRVKHSSYDQIKNFGFIDTGTIIPNLLAYHIGQPRQELLVTLKDKVNSFGNFVFFSANPRDVKYYLTPENPRDMVYFVDMTSLTDSRIQKNYQSSVIFRDQKNQDTDLSPKEITTDWYIKHTMPFNLNRLDRYRKARLDYLLIRAPIQIVF